MGVWHMGQIASAMRLSTDRIGLRAPLWGTLTVLRTGLCHMDGCGARCQARMGQSHGLRRSIWHKSSSGQQEAHAKSVGWVTGAQGTRTSINSTIWGVWQLRPWPQGGQFTFFLARPDLRLGCECHKSAFLGHGHPTGPCEVAASPPGAFVSFSNTNSE
jgi:hypothetical protein